MLQQPLPEILEGERGGFHQALVLSYFPAADRGKIKMLMGIVKLTGFRGTKPPYRVFRRGFTTDILGLVSACETLT